MCGYVKVDFFTGEAHDHRPTGSLISTVGIPSPTGIWIFWTSGPKGSLYAEAYDPEKHGQLLDWLKEADPLRMNGRDVKNRDGTKSAVHRHSARSGFFGSHEYEYE